MFQSLRKKLKGLARWWLSKEANSLRCQGSAVNLESYKFCSNQPPHYKSNAQHLQISRRITMQSLYRNRFNNHQRRTSQRLWLQPLLLLTRNWWTMERLFANQTPNRLQIKGRMMLKRKTVGSTNSHRLTRLWCRCPHRSKAEEKRDCFALATRTTREASAAQVVMIGAPTCPLVSTSLICSATIMIRRMPQSQTGSTFSIKVPT